MTHENASSEAPLELERLRAFVNTADLEAGTDRLARPSAASAWFAETGWTERAPRLSAADLALLHDLREALRGLALRNAGHDPGGAPEAILAAASRRAPVRVVLGGGRTSLVPAGHGVEAIVGRLLAIVHDASVAETWPRLKACANDRCRWLYFDRSRNGSRRWCTSAGCGNLMAARAYRARRRAERAGARA
jgi:predicted RNA-binding Zn ribbon-like protein